MHCLSTLFKLATLDDPAWDKRSMRQTLDPLSILDGTISSFEQASNFVRPNQQQVLGGGEAEGDRFTRSARLFRNMRPSWEAKLAPENLSSPDLAFAAQGGMVPQDLQLSEALSVDFSNDGWLMDFLMAPN